MEREGTAGGRAGLAIWPASAEAEPRARELARDLSLPVLPAGDVQNARFDLLLEVQADGLLLREAGARGGARIRADFTGGAVDYRRRRGQGGSARGDPIARAVGPCDGTGRLVDATAGLCRDAFLFAWLGWQVLAVERSPVVLELVRDALRRAGSVPDVAAIVAARLLLAAGDARDLLGRLPPAQRPDVVYIDPMYPPRRASALVKKEMRLLRQLVGDDGDAAELLAVARRVARRRVVVKRHARAAPLAGARPDFTSAGRSTRFDVYLVGGG